MIPMDSLTDLIGGVLLLPMIVSLGLTRTQRRAEKGRWLYFFSLLCASCLVGFIAHFVCEGHSRLAFDLIWILLYPLLVETMDAFLFLAMQIRTDGRRPTRCDALGLRLTSAVVALVSILLMWTVSESSLDIRVCVVYVVLLGVAGFILLARPAFSDRAPGVRWLFGALLPLLPAIYFQIERSTVIRVVWEFNYNAITHVFIILSEFILYVAALRRLRSRDA